MSAEEQWAQRKEWEQEKGELELKVILNLLMESPIKDYLCSAKDCPNKALWAYEIGPVAQRFGKTISLCEEHGDLEIAFDLYGKI